MCGIFGELAVAPEPPDRSAAFIASALKLLEHRGPDGNGVLQRDNLVLGHTRLSILDTSGAAAQPMVAEDGSALAFNGELYNYLELRAGLAPPRDGWSSTGDSQVLLELLRQRGLGGLRDAVGMFAFAYWSAQERRLTLVRDRLGKKPLYFTRSRTRLRFASELAPLVDPASPPRTRRDVLHAYLVRGYVPAPDTALVGIQVLEPGTALEVSVAQRPGGARLEERKTAYWELPPAQPGADRREWLAQFQSIFEDAVRVRLRSDVPLACFLSGGVDSSTVALVAQSQLDRPLRSLTMDFPAQSHSERAFAEEVARHLKTESVVSELRFDQVEHALEMVPLVYGDLFADSSALPTMAICGEAKKHATVVLSGDGGDELLAGYRHYGELIDLLALSTRHPRAARIANAFGRNLPQWVRGVRRLARATPDPAMALSRTMLFASPEQAAAILGCGPALARDTVADAFRHQSGRGVLLGAAAADTLTYLPGDILTKVDRASMAVALEVRSPLLDHRLFEHVTRAQPGWLRSAAATKLPLRELYASKLPAAVFERRKMGFGVPMARWFRGELAGLVRARLLGGDSALAGFASRRQLRVLVGSHISGLTDASAQIWALLVLESWLRRFKPSVID